MFVSPVYFYVSSVSASAFAANGMFTWYSRILAFSSMAILFVFLFFPPYLAIWKKKPKPMIFIAVQIVVFFACMSTLNAFDFDREKIDFLINKDRYISLIKEATLSKPEKKVYLIKIEPRYVNCERYLVYDESDDFNDPANKYFGIATEHRDVRVREYGDHMYVANACMFFN